MTRWRVFQFSLVHSVLTCTDKPHLCDFFSYFLSHLSRTLVILARLIIRKHQLVEPTKVQFSLSPSKSKFSLITTSTSYIITENPFIICTPLKPNLHQHTKHNFLAPSKVKFSLTPKFQSSLTPHKSQYSLTPKIQYSSKSNTKNSLTPKVQSSLSLNILHLLTITIKSPIFIDTTQNSIFVETPLSPIKRKKI